MTNPNHLSPVPSTAHASSPGELPAGSPLLFCWTQEDVAAALRVSERHLRKHINDPGMPQPRLLGTTRLWSPAAWARWLEGPEDAPDRDTSDDPATADTPTPSSRRRKTAAAKANEPAVASAAAKEFWKA